MRRFNTYRKAGDDIVIDKTVITIVSTHPSGVKLLIQSPDQTVIRVVPTLPPCPLTPEEIEAERKH